MPLESTGKTLDSRKEIEQDTRQHCFDVSDEQACPAALVIEKQIQQ